MNDNSEEELISSSFFDDNEESDEYIMPLWSKKFELESVSLKMSYLSNEILVNGALITKRKSRDQITQKYYKLFKDRIEAFKVIMLLK